MSSSQQQQQQQQQQQVLTLRAKQSQGVGRVLDLQAKSSAALLGNPESEIQWKVLVYDDAGEAIVSQLMRKGDLRQHNVTLFIHINTPRDPIPDVPAVYFLEPTSQNIRKLARDCERSLYESFHLHFTQPCPRPILEELAELAVMSQSVASIAKVVDQYLNFMCVEEQMFSLRMPDCFSILHDPSQRDDVIEHQIEQIALGIVSVLVTLKVVPVIRCPRGDHVSFAVCSQVEKHIRILRDQRNGPLSESSVGRVQNFQRPVLIVCERSWDITSSLRHAQTYQALCHEIFGINRNQVTCELDGKTQSFDLDTITDSFWKEARFKDIPSVAKFNDQKVHEWKEETKLIDANSSANNVENESAGSLIDHAATSSLTQAMNSLPMLRQKKRLLDTHTNLLSALFANMKVRKFNEYFEIEDKLQQGKQISSQDREKLFAILRDESVGTSTDKLRLMLLFLETVDPKNIQDELKTLERCVENQGIDMSSVVQWCSIKSFRASTSTAATATARDSKMSFFSMAETVGKRVASGVKTLIGGNNAQVPLTSLVDVLLDNTNSDADSHPYFDPKLGTPGDQPVPNRRKEPFRDAIVVVVGGANYIESQCLANYAMQQHSTSQASPAQSSSGTSGSNQRNIVYGGTHVITPRDLIDQLAALYVAQNPQQQQQQQQPGAASGSAKK